MPFCVACGAEHPPAARFCPSCGRAIAAVPAPAATTAQSRKVVTVLFADIVGSTALGERHDPETVQALLADYFETARTILRRHGGTVEKFIGDAVVAVFGVPESHEDDALRAVRAAVEFRAAVAELRSGSAEASPLEVCVGITTGEVVVGDASSGQSFSVGDAMNTAARLQSAAEAGQILIGDLTHELVADAVAAQPVGPLTLKGKHEAVSAWSVSEVVADTQGRRRRLDAPLVGRQAELAQLERSMSVVRTAGACRLVTLLGDAGVGKSKLAHDFVAGAGGTTLHGRCLSYGEGVTFWPLIEVVRGALGAEDATPEVVAELARPVLAADESADQVTERLLEIVSGGGVSNTQELFWAVRRFLEAVAGSGPVVLVVDDIHWAEPTFLDLLEYLATWTSAPLLLLCTARPDLVETRPEWARAHNADVIELAPLSGEHAEQLVGALLGHTGLEPGVAHRIAAASEGNPLYVEEMVRMLSDDAGAAAAADQWRVPPTVQALIAARLDRLDGPAQTALQQAAVVGTEFLLSDMAALAEQEAAESLASVMHTLVHREFVVPQPSAGEEAYRFSHGLIRDVAYGATPKRQRAKLHARFATWLQRRATTDEVEYDEIVGHHLGQAAALRIELELLDDETHTLAAQGCALLASAGRRAMMRSDMPAAAKLLRRAASLSLADDPLTAQLQVELCDALIEMGELSAVEDLVPAINATAERVGDEALRARAAITQAMLDMNLDVEIDRAEIIRTFDAAVSVLGGAGDFVGCAQAYLVLADVNWNDSRFEAAQKDLETALEFAQRAGDVRERGRILSWLVSALLWGPTHAADAIARCEQILEESSGDLLVEGKTLMILAGLYAFQGRFDDARLTFRGSAKIVEELGLSLTLASGTQVSGMIEMLAGDPAAAEAEFRRGYDALVAMGQKGYLPAAAAFLAGALLEQGRFDEAEALASELQATAAEDDEAAQGDYARIASRLAVARGDGSTAVDFARRAVAAYAGTDEVKSHADALHDLAIASAASGDAAGARDAADQARRLYEMKGIVPAVEAVDRLLGSLGDTADAVQ